MRIILLILFFASPLVAQTRADLDGKFGLGEVDRYRVRPGIAAEVTFSDDGKVKEFRVVPDDPKNPNATLPVDDVRKVVREIVGYTYIGRPQSYRRVDAPCPQSKSCKGFQEDFENLKTLMVWHKNSIAYASVTLIHKTFPPPGRMKLLPGYEHLRGNGIDTAAGKIRKIGGMEIHYDIGAMAGNFARRYEYSPMAEWTRAEQVKGDSVLIVLTKKNYIIATFEKATANFTATVKSQSDIDDFLKMILTY